MAAIRETGAVSGPGVLGVYGYDSLGRRVSLTRGNGTVTGYGYDAVSRLTSLSHDLGGTADDVAYSYTYNPAFQIKSSTRNNDAYAWNGGVQVNRAYMSNGLNQYSQSGNVALGYDAKGNLTSSGSAVYSYSQLNALYNVPGGYAFYDPLGRRDYVSATPTGTQWLEYAGDSLVSEYVGGAFARRYVWGPGTDEPLVWYEGSGTSDRRWYYADERGSIIGVANASGTSIAKNAYDEYGIPGSTNMGRFQYTGQQWLAELGMYHFKARTYSPTLGRFLQTDPIGVAGGVNLYAYVGVDPVNGVDPSGLVLERLDSFVMRIEPECRPGDYCITGHRTCGAFCTSVTDFVDIAAILEKVNLRPPSNLGESGGSDELPPIVVNCDAACRVKAKPPSRPSYCSSIGYIAGDILDKAGDIGIKTGGITMAAGGVQIAAAPATAGASGGSGLATVGTGAAMVEVGAGTQIVGKFVKFVSARGGRFAETDSAIGLLKVAPAFVKGVAGAVATVATGIFVNNPEKGPC